MSSISFFRLILFVTTYLLLISNEDNSKFSLIQVLGRTFRDFLNNLDNLHEYLRFTFHDMKAPSFFCEEETKDGLILNYHSLRRGYTSYVTGQLKQV